MSFDVIIFHVCSISSKPLALVYSTFLLCYGTTLLGIAAYPIVPKFQKHTEGRTKTIRIMTIIIIFHGAVTFIYFENQNNALS